MKDIPATELRPIVRRQSEATSCDVEQQMVPNTIHGAREMFRKSGARTRTAVGLPSINNVSGEPGPIPNPRYDKYFGGKLTKGIER